MQTKMVPFCIILKNVCTAKPDANSTEFGIQEAHVYTRVLLGRCNEL